MLMAPAHPCIFVGPLDASFGFQLLINTFRDRTSHPTRGVPEKALGPGWLRMRMLCSTSSQFPAQPSAWSGVRQLSPGSWYLLATQGQPVALVLEHTAAHYCRFRSRS